MASASELKADGPGRSTSVMEWMLSAGVSKVALPCRDPAPAQPILLILHKLLTLFFLPTAVSFISESALLESVANIHKKLARNAPAKSEDSLMGGRAEHLRSWIWDYRTRLLTWYSAIQRPLLLFTCIELANFMSIPFSLDMWQCMNVSSDGHAKLLGSLSWF